MAGLRDKLLWLSAEAAASTTACSQRGDTEGSFYARGLRDAYATAAVFVPDGTAEVIHAEVCQ
jgi:hypothetical protein